MNKIIRNLISGTVILSMSCSMVVSAAGSNKLNYSIKVNDEVVDSVFKGETVEVEMTLGDFDLFSIYDLAYRYDNSLVQLVNSNEETLTEANQVFYMDGDDVEANDDNPDGDPVVAYAKGTHGLIIGEEFANNAFLITSHIFPQKGLVRFSQQYIGEATGFDGVELAALKFKALAPTATGDTVLRYAKITNTDDDADYRNLTNGLGLSKDGYSFGLVAPSVYEIPEIVIYEKPTLEGISWGEENASDEYIVSWETPVEGCRGYELTVEKDGEKVGETINLGKDITSYDMFEIIKDSKDGDGVEKYKVTLVALGGVGSGPVSAEKEVSGIPLAKPENVVLSDEENLTWDPVENADKYTVTITTADGQPVDSMTVTDTEVDLSEILTVGDYKIVVTAISNESLYIPSTSDEEEYSTGSLVKGTIHYLVDNQIDLKWNEDIAGTVTLVDKDGQTYSAKIQEDGTFEISGVVNGDYEVEISRPTATTRKFSEKLVFTKSTEKNIGAKDGEAYKTITIFLGDVVEDDNMGVQAVDLSKLVSLNGVTSDKTQYSKYIDYIKERKQDAQPTINGDEIRVGIVNYYKDIESYNYEPYASEYDFTIN